MQKINIIGIAGLPRSGKDTAAEYIMSKGYFGVSLGDMVRDESRKRHSSAPDPISVKNMTETANWLRLNNGADFALKKALDSFIEAGGMNKYKGLVVFSVRAPVEADFIIKKGGQLIWVESSDTTRYERAISNLRSGEKKISLEEFKKQEALQSRPQDGIPHEAQMNTEYVKSKANKKIENNSNDIKKFIEKLQNILDI